MKKTLTDITVLLDRSGSMHICRNDTIGGFNSFVKEQKKVKGEATINVIQFDHEYDVLYEPQPLDKVKLGENYVPRGATALYDAICRSIDETHERLSAMKKADRPKLVIFAIITDGFENSSVKHKIQDVNARITRQQDEYQWQFVFLAANQDAIAQASNMGMNPGFAMSYGQTAQGTQAAYVAMSSNMAQARSGVASGQSVTSAASSLNFTSAQKDVQDKEIEKTGGKKNRKVH